MIVTSCAHSCRNGSPTHASTASWSPAEPATGRDSTPEALLPLLELGSTARDNLVLLAPRGEIVRASLKELREARERCLSPIVGE